MVTDISRIAQERQEAVLARPVEGYSRFCHKRIQRLHEILELQPEVEQEIARLTKLWKTAITHDCLTIMDISNKRAEAKRISQERFRIHCENHLEPIRRLLEQYEGFSEYPDLNIAQLIVEPARDELRKCHNILKKNL